MGDAGSDVPRSSDGENMSSIRVQRKSDDRLTAEGFELQEVSRRECLRVALLASGGAIAAPLAIAQEASVESAVRAMSPMTGSDLAAARIEPTSGLVGIIVAISKPLREIDLGEMEPATFYVAD